MIDNSKDEPKPRDYYVVMLVQPWSALEMVPDSPLPFPVSVRTLETEEGMVGFLPVFSTREAAREWCGDDDLVYVARVDLSRCDQKRGNGHGADA